MAFLCLAGCGCVSADVSPGSPRIWDSDMLLSLPYGFCEALEKMGAMAVLHNPSFDMSLGYVAIVIVLTSICRRVRLHAFPTISA